jgi:MoxR-like ATPase
LGLTPLISPQEILDIQKNAHRIFCSEEIESYIVSIVNATRNTKSHGLQMEKYIEYGASPRASIGLYMASKAKALMSSRTFVRPQDVKDVAHDVMRHRIMLNYEGQADQISVDSIISEVLDKVAVP